MPSLLERPFVWRKPKSLLCELGILMEPPVSEPLPIAAKLAAMGAPVPPIGPPG